MAGTIATRLSIPVNENEKLLFRKKIEKPAKKIINPANINFFIIV
jgi:hypothetical protein